MNYLDMFPWYAYLTVLSFVWGACVGSYLNVCIHRIPRELSTVAPRSFCPNCHNQIAWYNNIPLLSFFLLGAKCKNCRKAISSRYVLIEFLVALLFLLIWLKYAYTDGPRPLRLVAVSDWKLVPIYWLAAAGLILGTFVDFEHLIIPDRVTIGGMVVGLIVSALVPALHGEATFLTNSRFFPALPPLPWALIKSAIGVAVGFGILWAIALAGRLWFKREAMGFGDVKLLGAIGAFMGWQAALFTLVLSSFFGTIVGLTLIACRNRGMRSRIPYGPYIALAALLWILWGSAWWQMYIDFIFRTRLPM